MYLQRKLRLAEGLLTNRNMLTLEVSTNRNSMRTNALLLIWNPMMERWPPHVWVTMHPGRSRNFCIPSNSVSNNSIERKLRPAACPFPHSVLAVPVTFHARPGKLYWPPAVKWLPTLMPKHSEHHPLASPSCPSWRPWLRLYQIWNFPQDSSLMSGGEQQQRSSFWTVL